MEYSRRELIAGGAMAGLLLLPGCSNLPGLSLTEAIKRLLTLSSQNAFSELLQPHGFLESQVASLQVPEFLGGNTTNAMASILLRSKPMQNRLLKVVNRAAEKGADLAAPIVADTIRNMSIADAAAIISGGPTAATDLLQGQLGNTLVNRMIPGIGQGLELFDNDIINQVVRELANVDIARIRGDVSDKTSHAIFRAIGAQETIIRANPERTNDPILIAVFGLS